MPVIELIKVKLIPNNSLCLVFPSKQFQVVFARQLEAVCSSRGVLDLCQGIDEMGTMIDMTFSQAHSNFCAERRIAQGSKK